jgi:hypothetical protein
MPTALLERHGIDYDAVTPRFAAGEFNAHPTQLCTRSPTGS